MSEHLRTESPECTLEVTVDYPERTRLRLTYTVKNRSALPVYLFNQLYTELLPGKVFAIDPQVVHVRQAGSQVIFSKAIVPVPGGLEVEYRYVPCLSKLLPNETFEESFEVALPVSPYSAYTPWLLRHAPEDRALSFEVGYFAATPQAETMIKEVAASNHGLAYRIDPFPLSSQQLLLTGPFKQPVPVFTSK